MVVKFTTLFSKLTTYFFFINSSKLFNSKRGIKNVILKDKAKFSRISIKFNSINTNNNYEYLKVLN